MLGRGGLGRASRWGFWVVWFVAGECEVSPEHVLLRAYCLQGVPWTLPAVLVPTCLVEEKRRLSAEVLGRFPISIGLWSPLRPHVAHLENRTSQWYPTAPSVPVRSPYIQVMGRALPMLAATVASVRSTEDADVKGQQSQTG